MWWPWCRLAATAPIQPLAWELPYATDSAIERKKRKKKFNTLKLYELTLINVIWEEEKVEHRKTTFYKM